MEAAPRLEALTIGMILDRTFRLYKQNFALMLGIVAVAYIPYYAVYFLGAQLLPGQNPGALTLAGILLGGLMLIVWVLFVLTLSTGAATYAISERYLGKEVSISSAFKVAWNHLGTLVWTQLVVGMIVMIGYFLLVVPGILWMLSYSLVVPIIVLEAATSERSRDRSWNLVSGNRFKVLVVLGLFWVVALSMGLAGAAAVGLTVGLESELGNLLSDSVGVIAQLFISPLQIIAVILLYYDLRIRKEGFDLEMLSEALARQGLPA